MLHLAVKNLLGKRGIAALALVGVGLGSALIIVLFSLSGGLTRHLDETASTLAGRLVVSPKDALFGGIIFSSGTPLPGRDLRLVRRIPDVREAYGRVSASLTPTAYPELLLPVTGYSPEEIHSTGDTPFARIVQGRAPVNDREIIIGRQLYGSLAFIGQKLAVGRSYPFQLPDGVHTVDLKVTGVFQTHDEITDTSVAATAALARLFNPLSSDQYSSLSVMVDRPDQVLPVEQSILRDLDGRGPAVQVVAPRDLLDPLEGILRVVNRFLFGLSLVFALGCTFFVSIIMSITVLERLKEFGILKAVGWRAIHITRLVLLESSLLAALGTVIGLAVGYGVSLAAAYFWKAGLSLPGWPLILRTAGLAAVVGTFGGIYPAWRANRAAPAEIFRQG